MSQRHRAEHPWSRRDTLLASAALALAFFILAPMLTTGFMGDDVFTSLQTPALRRATGTSVPQKAWQDTVDWARKQGRVFPLSAYVYPLFYAVDGNTLLYKSFILALILSNVALFGLLVRRLTGSTDLAVVAALLPPILIQYRPFHDPVLAYAGLLPLITLYTLVSLLGLTEYIRGGRKRHLALSIGAYAAALFTYEVAVPLFLLHLAIARWYPRRHSLRTVVKFAWPFPALAGAITAGVIALRLALAIPMQGAANRNYVPNLDPAAFLLTVARQMVAALPLSYHAYTLWSTDATHERPQWFDGLFTYLGRYPLTSLVVFAGLASITAVALVGAGKRSDPGSTRLGLLTVLGGGLVVLPSVLIALSPRWQVEVYWGVGYLPVYLSYLGVALLVVAGVAWVMTAVGHRAARIGVVAAIAVAIAAVGVVSYQDNRTVVEIQNRAFARPRRVVEAAVARGLLANLRNGDTVISESDQLWQNKDFYLGAAGLALRDVQLINDVTAATLPAGGKRETRPDGTVLVAYGPSARVFYSRYAGPTEASGFALVGRVNTLVLTPQGVSDLVLDSARLYTTSAKVSEIEPILVGGQPFTTPPLDSPTTFGLDPAVLRPVASGPDWALDDLALSQVVIER